MVTNAITPYVLIMLLSTGSKMVAHAITPDVLDPSELRSFWVSWKDGLIQIGPYKYRNFMTFLEYKVKWKHHFIKLSTNRPNFLIHSFPGGILQCS